MSGRKPPRRKLFDWCENCASRVQETRPEVHSGHVLITWTTKDRDTILGYSGQGLREHR